jgi:1-acyl-sn-glycerol-3-phosphate acyltransferase
MGRWVLGWYLRKLYGIASIECRHVERYEASLQAGHAILLTPNHCRLSDPLVLGQLVIDTGVNLHAMASWHLFRDGGVTRFLARRMGAFSVYREGVDRQAISTAIDILQHGRRPLIIFPEGALSRHNDKLMALMDGTAFVARTAAKRRAKLAPDSKVVVHPVAIRYYFHGNLEASLAPVLSEIESHFAWRPQDDKALIQRIRQVGEALLSLKEIEYFGRAQQGELFERVDKLIDHLLCPLEEEWKIKERARGVVGRVKNLRAAILPDMVSGQLPTHERDRRWRQLAACYYAQQMSLYPRDYLQPENNVPEHILETVERFEEDLTDHLRVHGPLRAVVDMGEAIPVDTDRGPKGETDPLMKQIGQQLQQMLDELAAESQRR